MNGMEAATRQLWHNNAHFSKVRAIGSQAMTPLSDDSARSLARADIIGCVQQFLLFAHDDHSGHCRSWRSPHPVLLHRYARTTAQPHAHPPPHVLLHGTRFLTWTEQAEAMGDSSRKCSTKTCRGMLASMKRALPSSPLLPSCLASLGSQCARPIFEAPFVLWCACAELSITNALY